MTRTSTKRHAHKEEVRRRSGFHLQWKGNARGGLLTGMKRVRVNQTVFRASGGASRDFLWRGQNLHGGLALREASEKRLRKGSFHKIEEHKSGRVVSDGNLVKERGADGRRGSGIRVSSSAGLTSTP